MLKSHRVSLTVVMAIFIGIIAGLIIASNFDWTKKSQAFDSSQPQPEIVLGSSEPVSQELLDLQRTSNAFVQISKEVSPAVVTITSESVVSTVDPFSQMFPEEFRRFFSIPEQDRDRIRQGLGSGVIVNPDGYVLTNHHVIADADEIFVVIDGENYPAKVVGSDSETDIAVVKIDIRDLPTVKFGDSDELEVGEWVLAIGNPISQLFEKTVTAGIVSAKGRSLSGLGNISYQDFIQTDAAINPGNSGGALVNLRGELIGINTAIVGQANIGIGFAIPINLAKWVMDQLITEGKVTRGWLGVQIQSMDHAIAEGLGLEEPTGALVTQIVPDTPAEKAGIQERDVILQVEDQKIESSDHLSRVIAAIRPGTEVDLLILRDGRERTITVELERRPSDEDTNESEAVDEAATRIGISVQDITADIARSLNLDSRNGVLISEIEARSIAAREGLQRGDIILEVNQEPVNSAREFRRIIAAAEEGDSILLYVQRSDRRFFTGLRVPSNE